MKRGRESKPHVVNFVVHAFDCYRLIMGKCGN